MIKQKILLISGIDENHENFTPWSRCLGHEIHITRIIVLDMLLQNKINEDDIIVTFDDRKFLYNQIFKNIINYKNYLELNKDNFIIIPIVIYNGHYVRKVINIKEFNIINYTIPDTFYTEEFKKLCGKIDFLNLYDNLDYNFINNLFIVIHHRFNQNIDKLLNILYIIKKINIKIIIFNHQILQLKDKINDNNIIYIDNLQVYASLLNNINCKLFISEWSGGGQLSQYTCNSTILYYFDNYLDHYNPLIDNKDREKNSIISKYIGNDYDFKCITNCTRIYYNNYNDFINNLEKIL